MHATLLLLLLTVDPGAVRPNPACAAEVFSDAEGRLEAWSREPVDAASLKEALSRTTRELRELTELFSRIAAARCGERSVNAMALVGRLFTRFEEKVSALPPPPQLADDARAVYRATLETNRVPLRARARTAYEQAVALAGQLRVSNAYVDEAAKWLAANPAPPPDDFEGPLPDAPIRE